MASIEEALAPIRQSLRADGYELRIEEARAGVLRLSVFPLEGACAECLIPKELMEAMIQRLVPVGGDVREIDLRYPDELG